jgi:urea carboxylase system permease
VEIIGAILMVVLLFASAERGPGVVLETNGVQGDGNYIFAFLASMLMAAYVMYGFDSAAELSEETTDPRGTAPRAILQAIGISFVGGGLMILASLMAAPALDAPELSTEGIAWVISSQLDSWMAKVLLSIVAVAIFSAVLAIQASAARVMFSMARDGRLPFAATLAKVNPRTSTPLYTGVTVSALAISVLVVNLGQSSVFAAVAAVSVVVVYAAYLMVTVPALIHRLRRTGGASAPEGFFTLGRWGLPVNLIAVGMGLFLLVNIAWPRVAVYDPAGTGHWYLQYFPLLFVALLAGVGLLAYRRMLREHGVTTHGVIDLTHPRDAETGEPVEHLTADS